MSGPPLTRQDIIRQLALKSGVSPRPAVPPQMDIPATENEMAAWLHRGGKIPAGIPPIGGELHMPGGTFGGEFSDEDIAAFQDAAKKLGLARSLNHLSEIFAHQQPIPTKPDATAVSLPSIPK